MTCGWLCALAVLLVRAAGTIAAGRRESRLSVFLRTRQRCLKGLHLFHDAFNNIGGG